MKLYRHEAVICKNQIYIIPTITLIWDMPIYYKRNFSIEFHWLIFNARLLWMEENE